MNKKYIQVTIISIVGILLICGCTQTSKNTKDSQKGSELEAVDTLHILQVGEKAVDAELFDMQGNKHHLFEAFADGRYVLLDFWNLHCGSCRKAESELQEVYDRMKGRLEIVAINLDSIPEWQAHEWSKKIVWKNWNDGKKFKEGGIKSHYYDFNAVPFYVLLSPDGRILWEMTGYVTGSFLGMTEALNGPKQDNFANPNLAIRKIDVGNKGTTISFRYYTEKGFWFSIAHDRAKYGTEINCCDFTLTFEPFDTIPTTFDFKEGDGEDVFVIRNVSVK